MLIDFEKIQMDDSKEPHIYVSGDLALVAGTYYMRSWMMTNKRLVISDNEVSFTIK